MSIPVNQSQGYRVCQAAAEAIDEPTLDAPSADMQRTLDNEQAVVYGMVDGAMLFTDDGWQEIKAGRLVSAEIADDCWQAGKNERKWETGQSEYVDRMGSYKRQ